MTRVHVVVAVVLASIAGCACGGTAQRSGASSGAENHETTRPTPPATPGSDPPRANPDPTRSDRASARLPERVVIYRAGARPGGPDDYGRSFRSEIRCHDDSDCTVGAPPSCGPCGSCSGLMSSAPQPARTCPPQPSYVGPDAPPPPNCSPCPASPNYAVCVDERCAGGGQAPYGTNRCTSDDDCLAVWMNDCCSCPTDVSPMSRAGYDAVVEFCAATPCSATRASSPEGPRACEPTTAELGEWRATCVHNRCQVEQRAQAIP